MDDQTKEIPLDQLPPQSLVNLKKQVEEEIVLLAQSLEQFKTAYARFEDSKNVLEQFAQKDSLNQETLIPLTSSLYVSGTIENNTTVLVDYGTGYFVERNIEQGKMYCSRKGQLIKDNMEKISQNVTQKKKIIDNITLILQKKMAAIQQQQAAQQGVKKERLNLLQSALVEREKDNEEKHAHRTEEIRLKKTEIKERALAKI